MSLQSGGRGNTFTVLVSLLNLFQPFSPFSPPSLPLLSPFSLPPLSPSSLPPCPPHPGFHCHNKAMVCRWTASCHRPPSLSTYWHALSAASDHPFLPSIWVEPEKGWNESQRLLFDSRGGAWNSTSSIWHGSNMKRPNINNCYRVIIFQSLNGPF